MINANDLMNMKLPPETAEAAYRRGYCDGYAVAVNDFGGSRTAKEKLLDKMYRFWRIDLTKWRQSKDKSRMNWPPEFTE